MREFSSVDSLIAAVTNQGLTTVYLKFSSEVRDNPAKNLEEITKLAEFLKESPPLSNLGIRDNNLGEEAGKAIGEALATNRTLSRLWISNNSLGEEGGKAIGKALATNRALYILDIRDNNLGEEAGKAIGEALLTNKTLSTLLINRNFLGKEAGKAISNALLTNKTLSKVSINNNYLGEEAGRNFAEALAINITILELSCSDIVLNNETIASSLARNAGINDAIKDVATSIVLPMLIKAIDADPTLTEKDKENLNLGDYTRELISLTQEKLCAGVSTEAIVAFAKHWHNPLQQRRILQHKDYAGLAWSSLLGTDEIPLPPEVMGVDGWKLVSRLNPAALKEEGKKLDHCVGGYSGMCITGETHIVSVVNPAGEPVSTLDFKTDYDSQELSLTQHYGRANNMPPQETEKALKWYVEEVEAGRLTIDYAGLSQARDARIAQEKTLKHKSILTIGFNPFDREKCKHVGGSYNRMLAEQDTTLRDNFGQLLAIREIVLSEDKVFMVPTALTKAGKSKTTLAKDKILSNIQAVLDELAGEGAFSASLVPSHDMKNKFGDVLIIPKKDVAVIYDISKLFADKSYEGNAMRINGLSPIPILHILEGALQKSKQLHVVDSLYKIGCGQSR